MSYFQTFLSNHHGFEKSWNFINLIVGNSRRINCKTKGYRKVMALTVMTLYLAMFTFGLFAGDLLATKIIELEKLVGIISTALIYSMGSSIIFDAFKSKCCTFAASISGIMVLTQTAFVFNLFPMPVIHIFYYIASIIMMLFVYGFVHREKAKVTDVST